MTEVDRNLIELDAQPESILQVRDNASPIHQRKRSSLYMTIPSLMKPKEVIPEGSIRPYSYRENTARHAVMDSWQAMDLPTFSALPTLPSLTSFPKKFPKRSPTISKKPPILIEEKVDREMTSPRLHMRESSRMSVVSASSADDPISNTSEDGFSTFSGDILVMGGYRGSILRSAKTGKRLWIPLKVGFGFTTPDLKIGLNEVDEDSCHVNIPSDGFNKEREGIVPGKMLMSVGGVIDLGKTLKDKLKAMELSRGRDKVRFHNFGYDWRISLPKSAEQLTKKLIQLKEASAARGENHGKGFGTTIIAHSMGGLVVLDVLSKVLEPSIIRGVIFAGTPFQGCVNSLGPLKLGDGIMFNKTIGPPDVVFSMRSTFYLVPPNHEAFEDREGNKILIDLHDPKSWWKYHLSPLTVRKSNSATSTLTDSPLKHTRNRSSVSQILDGVVRCLNNKPARQRGASLLSDSRSNKGNLFPTKRPPGDLSRQRKSSQVLQKTFSRLNSFRLPQTPNDTTEGENEKTNENLDEKVILEHSFTEEESTGLVQKQISQSPVEDVIAESPSEESSSSSHREVKKTNTPTLLPSNQESEQNIEEYLERTLTQVSLFHHILANGYRDGVKYPPMAIVASHETATVRGICVESEKDISQNEYGNLIFGDGDGIVTWASSTNMPGRWSECLVDIPSTNNSIHKEKLCKYGPIKGVAESPFGHVSMMADLERIGQCLAALKRAENRCK